jgi:hypothetical protein
MITAASILYTACSMDYSLENSFWFVDLPGYRSGKSKAAKLKFSKGQCLLLACVRASIANTRSLLETTLRSLQLM